MLHSSARPTSDSTPLVAYARDQPIRRRRRARRRTLIAIVVIVALIAAAALFAVASYTSAAAIPAPTLQAAAPEATPTPATTDGAADAAAGPVTDTLSGQPVWLAQPAGDPVGIAYLLPGIDDSPEALVQSPTAAALVADGWAVATGALTGVSWGSPASTQSLSELRDWAGEAVGDVPVLYVGTGMGATTAVTSMTRDPAAAVACSYSIAPITDLATLIGAQPEVADQIAVAWGRLPAVEENPSLATASLPSATLYRVVIPAAPQVLVDDANAFLAALEDSGHTVTSVTAPENATPESFTDDLIAFAEGCQA